MREEPKERKRRIRKRKKINRSKIMKNMKGCTKEWKEVLISLRQKFALAKQFRI